MQIWKVVYRDGSAVHLWAETAYEVLHEMLRDQAADIAYVHSLVRNVCEDRTSPHAPSGTPGHRSPTLRYNAKMSPQASRGPTSPKNRLIGQLRRVYGIVPEPAF